MVQVVQRYILVQRSLTGTASPQVQMRWKIVGTSLTGNNKIHGLYHYNGNDINNYIIEEKKWFKNFKTIIQSN